MSDRSAWSRASLAVLGTRLSSYPIKLVVVLLVAPILGTANYGVIVSHAVDKFLDGLKAGEPDQVAAGGGEPS